MKINGWFLYDGYKVGDFDMNFNAFLSVFTYLAKRAVLDKNVVL